MKANGPPQRTGAPKAETENHPTQAGREQSDRRFAWVTVVSEAKKSGDDYGGCPEAQGCTVTGFERPLVEPGESARERVLNIPTIDVLLKQSDQKEAKQPDSSIAENVTAKEQTAVDNQEAALP